MLWSLVVASLLFQEPVPTSRIEGNAGWSVADERVQFTPASRLRAMDPRNSVHIGIVEVIVSCLIVDNGHLAQCRVESEPPNRAMGRQVIASLRDLQVSFQEEGPQPQDTLWITVRVEGTRIHDRQRRR